MPTAGVIILQVNIFVKYFLSEIQSFLSTENCGDMVKAFASQTADISAAPFSSGCSSRLLSLTTFSRHTPYFSPFPPSFICHRQRSAEKPREPGGRSLFLQRKKEYLSIFLEIAETCQYFAPQSQLRCPPFLAVHGFDLLLLGGRSFILF